ncbi:small acid-soluble spore protein Tlp [Bacillus sp. CLL-7-23]|uniref:Small, acid-soluble spore protein Tlp n=1 Tax=Bacillus changyiensis TaxID=3004103 RepID=A0ABT4X838_9BACI|nr:small acid-soluble spore protein Tlp [Bacillus changyiensis]MDA7027914.1 small acid-soluble spore protein Tlp [Bacillus changyiensis]
MQRHKHKPDDRSDNVEKLQNMVQNTIENIEESEEQLSFANDEDKRRIRAKNERRNESIDAMRNEIHDEAEAQQKNRYNQ